MTAIPEYLTLPVAQGNQVTFIQHAGLNPDTRMTHHLLSKLYTALKTSHQAGSSATSHSNFREAPGAP